jgi:hypothetical protein
MNGTLRTGVARTLGADNKGLEGNWALHVVDKVELRETTVVEMGIGTIEWQLTASERATWLLIETSRRTPHFCI